MKVVYLSIKSASKKWTLPIRNWKPALNQMIIRYKKEESVTQEG